MLLIVWGPGSSLRDGVGWGCSKGCKGGGAGDLGPSFPAPELLHLGWVLPWCLQGGKDGSLL